MTTHLDVIGNAGGKVAICVGRTLRLYGRIRKSAAALPCSMHGALSRLDCSMSDRMPFDTAYHRAKAGAGRAKRGQRSCTQQDGELLGGASRSVPLHMRMGMELAMAVKGQLSLPPSACKTAMSTSCAQRDAHRAAQVAERRVQARSQASAAGLCSDGMSQRGGVGSDA
jgi:hypothetical protein